MELSGLSSTRDEQLVRLANHGSIPETEAAPTILQSVRHETSNRKSMIIVAASFTMVFTCCGLNFAFGVFQELYDGMARQPNTPFAGATPALIDLIGTISISVMTIIAPFSVAWAKRFSPRWISFIGGFIFGLSLILASFGTTLWHFELTQGLLLGIGTSMPYMVAVTVAPVWFTARRGLAMGIILAGTGVGGLVWAPVIKVLIDSVGFRNSLRVSGVVSFVLVALSSAAMSWEPQALARINAENASRTGRLQGILNVPLVDWRVAKTRKFAAQGLGAILQAAAYYTPVFFFASYAGTLGYSATAGANFIALSNACNAIGKIVIGYFADRLGRLNTLFLTTFISAAITLSFWVPSAVYGSTDNSRGLFISFTVLYGLFAGAYVSLFPASLIEIFGIQNFASVNGVLYMVRGLATLIGTPVGGALIRSSTESAAFAPHGYVNMAVLVGVLLFAASIAVFWIRVEAMVGPSGQWHPKWRM